MDKQKSNYVTGTESVDGECKEEKFLSEDGDSIHPAVIQDGRNETNNNMNIKDQREVIQMENHIKEAIVKEESTAADIIDISDESNGETASSDYLSDTSFGIEKVKVKVTTISQKICHHKTIKKKKVTTIETQRRVDRRITNQKDFSLRGNDLLKKCAGAKKASELIRKGEKKVSEQDKNRRRITLNNEKSSDVQSTINKNLKPFTDLKDSNFCGASNVPKNPKTFENSEKVDNSLREERRKSSEQDKNNFQVASENTKKQDVGFKIGKMSKIDSPVENSYFDEEIQSVEDSSSSVSREKISERNEYETRALDEDKLMDMNGSDCSDIVTPNSIVMIEKQKKYSQFGVAIVLDTANRDFVTSQVLADNFDTGSRRKTDFRKEESENNGQNVERAREQISADCQDIIVVSDSDVEENSCYKNSLENQSLKKNSVNFHENSAERKKTGLTFREDGIAFFCQEKDSTVIECNNSHEKSNSNNPSEKAKNSETKTRFAVKEDGNKYYNNISLVQPAFGQCFDSEKSANNKIKYKENIFGKKRDQQKFAEEKDNNEKKPYKRLHNDTLIPDEQISDERNRTCTGKKSVGGNRFKEAKRVRNQKLVDVEKWLYDNRYYKENLSFLDNPVEDENRQFEVIETRHEDRKLAREEKSQRQGIQDQFEEVKTADKEKIDNGQRFFEVDRSADENLTANANRSPQKNRVVNEYEFPQENIITNENQVANKSRNPNENRVANESRNANENRIGNENVIANENRIGNENVIANENRIGNENVIANENRFSENQIAKENRYPQKNRLAAITDPPKIGSSEPLTSVEKKYSEFGVLNVSYNDSVVKPQLFSTNLETKRRYKTEIKGEEDEEDSIEEISENLGAFEDIIVLSDSDEEDNLAHERCLNNKLFGEHCQNFIDSSTDKKKVTLLYEKNDVQLSLQEKTQEKNNESKRKLFSDSDNINEKTNFNERREENEEKRNCSLSAPKFIIKKNETSIDFVHTGSDSRIKHSIEEERQFANDELLCDRQKSENDKKTRKRPHNKFFDKKKLVDEKRARLEKKCRNKDYRNEEQKIDDKNDVNLKCRLEKEFFEEKRCGEENASNKGEILRDEELMELERVLGDDIDDERNFDENQSVTDKQSDEKNRRREPIGLTDEEIIRELERIHNESESEDEKSGHKENRAEGKKSLREENRDHGEKQIVEKKGTTDQKRTDKEKEEKRSDEKRRFFADKCPHKERQSSERKPDLEERQIAEEQRPTKKKRYSEENRHARERQSTKEKRSAEDRKSSEEKRSAEDSKSAEEKRPAEGKRSTEEKRPAEDKKSAEEKRSVVDKRPSEKTLFAEEDNFSDEVAFRSFDIRLGENQTDSIHESDQRRFSEVKRSNLVDTKSPHRVPTDDRKTIDDKENLSKSHKRDSEEHENRHENPENLADNNMTPHRNKILKDHRSKSNSYPIVLIKKLDMVEKLVPIVEPIFLPKDDRRASYSNIINSNKSVDKKEVNASSPSTSQSSEFTTNDFRKEKDEDTKNRQIKSLSELSKSHLAQKTILEEKNHVAEKKWRRINYPCARMLPISKQPTMPLTSEEKKNIKAIRKKQLREIAEAPKNPTSEESATLPIAIPEVDDESSAKRVAAQSAKVTEEPRGYSVFSKPLDRRAKKKSVKLNRSIKGKKSEEKIDRIITKPDDVAIDNSDESENEDTLQNLETLISEDMENFVIDGKIEERESEKLRKRTILVSETRKKSQLSKTVKRVSFDDNATEIHEYEIKPGHKMRKFGPTDLVQWKNRIKNNDENLQPVNDNIIYPKLEEFLAHIFQWNPRWLKGQNEIKSSPPIVDESKLTPMLSCYRTYEEYYKIAEPLLALEMWYGISNDFELGKTHLNFFSIVPNSINVIPIYFTNVELSTLVLEVVVSQQELQMQAHPVYGDLLFFEYYSNKKYNQGFASWEVFAYVTSLRKTPITSLTDLNRDLINAVKEPHTLLTYTVMTKALDYKDVQTNRVNQLRTISYIRSNMRMVQALQTLPKSPLMNIILHPKVEDYQLPAAKNIETYPLVTKDSLNEKQLEAVMKITEVVVQKLPKVCLIQGPPGTGKSKVIVNLVTQILYGDDRYQNDKKMRILVCAPSNAAVDEIVLRLINVRKSFDEEKRFNIVRTGRIETIHPSAKIVSLRELAKKRVNESSNSNPSTSINGHRDEYESLTSRKFTKRYKEAEEELLKNADVIASTLTSCYTNQMESIFGEKSGTISVCIVDEATQSAEPENLIPLMLGVNTLVLVGDTNQLPATVLSQKAKQFGLDQSLFARIWRVFEGEPNNPIIQLNTQYRMTVPISHFPNKYFYGGALKNAAKMHKLPFHFYRVINLDSTQDPNKFSNVEEADFVANLVYTMIARTNYDNVILPVKVGIITPYNNQKNLLRKRISERVSRLKDKNKIVYEVNTVDSFQGQERDVIIMSCVRSNGIGFLSDRQRLCVALTRAKHSLILCGNFRTFHRDSMWKALLSDAQTRNVYLNVKSNANPVDIRWHIIR